MWVIAGERRGALLETIAAIPDEKITELFATTSDENALEKIIKRYGDKIYGVAFRITRDHNSAEEVLQEVFLTLTKKVDTFRGESKLSSWLN